MTGPEEHAAISVGAMVGGTSPDSRRWRDAVMALARRVKEVRSGFRSPLNVNVVYQIPGEVLPALDFSGVRTGRYSSSKKLLLVQAAVPVELPPDMNDFLLGLLEEAIEEAERFAMRKGITTQPLAELRDLTQQLRAS
jgi:hypothetical protein